MRVLSDIMKNKVVIHGIIASMALASVYFAILTAVQSFSHAIQQFATIWYFMIPLIAGFGIQVGLYSYIRSSLHSKAKPNDAKGVYASSAGVAASGGVSTGSMIACCAHHLTDVLPLIGFSAASLFLTKYQTPLILLGVFSSLIGTIYMLEMIQKHKLYDKKSFAGKIMKYNMNNARTVIIILSSAVLLASFMVLTL